MYLSITSALHAKGMPTTYRGTREPILQGRQGVSKEDVEVGEATPEIVALARSSNAKSKSRPWRASSTSKGGAWARARASGPVYLSLTSVSHTKCMPTTHLGVLAHPPRPASKRKGRSRGRGRRGRPTRSRRPRARAWARAPAYLSATSAPHAKGMPTTHPRIPEPILQGRCRGGRGEAGDSGVGV